MLLKTGYATQNRLRLRTTVQCFLVQYFPCCFPSVKNDNTYPSLTQACHAHITCQGRTFNHDRARRRRDAPASDFGERFPPGQVDVMLAAPNLPSDQETIRPDPISRTVRRDPTSTLNDNVVNPLHAVNCRTTLIQVSPQERRNADSDAPIPITRM